MTESKKNSGWKEVDLNDDSLPAGIDLSKLVCSDDQADLLMERANKYPKLNFYRFIEKQYGYVSDRFIDFILYEMLED